ncbi:MAG: GNAT family N-acetyltransferase [Thermoguttaceae bacterium]
MIDVEEINDPEQLTDRRLLWNALFPQTPGATFFQSLDWLEVYCRHFAAAQRLRVLVVSADGRPVGILPLVVQTERTRLGRVRTLTYPLHDWGTFYGPIGPNPTATLLAGLRHVRRTPRDWDMLDLRWVDVDGCDRGRTERAMELTGFPPSKQVWDVAPRIEIEGTWQAYWSSRDKKWRHNIDRCGRRLAEQGEVAFVRYRPAGAAEGDGDPRWDLYDACVDVAGRSWQSGADDGTTLSSPEVSQYLRDTHAAAARAGGVDANLLLLGGRPVAFVYNYVYDGCVYGLRKGFDPEFAALRPGLILEKMMMEDGFRRGDRTYDLGVGSLAIKRPWQTRVAASYRFTYFPVGISRVQLLRLKRWLTGRIKGPSYPACRQGV